MIWIALGIAAAGLSVGLGLVMVGAGLMSLGKSLERPKVEINPGWGD